MIDLLQIADFFDADTRRDLLAEMRAVAAAPATVTGQGHGGAVAMHTRKASRLALSAETRLRVRAALLERKAALEAHFGLTLDGCEEPQFLRYEVGDFFVAHQDGNTPILRDDSRFRKVSAVVFLNARGEEPAAGTYGGGALVFHGPYTGPTLRVPLAPEPGTLVAFRAETTHEVVPVTHGERFTIAAFFRADGE